MAFWRQAQPVFCYNFQHLGPLSEAFVKKGKLFPSSLWKQKQSWVPLILAENCLFSKWHQTGFSLQTTQLPLLFPGHHSHDLSEWVKSLSHVQLFVTPMDCSLPGSSIHGILQARVLEWGAISFLWFRFNLNGKAKTACAWLCLPLGLM